LKLHSDGMQYMVFFLFVNNTNNWNTEIHKEYNQLMLGRAIAQAVSRWLPTAAALV
jgi:hypothetical protein